MAERTAEQDRIRSLRRKQKLLLMGGANALGFAGIGTGSGPSGSKGILLEDGTSFLLAENGDFIIQEG